MGGPLLRPPSPDPAGLAVLLVVILLMHGLDLRAQLPTLATPIPGSLGRPSSVHPPQTAREPHAHQKVSECSGFASLGTPQPGGNRPDLQPPSPGHHVLWGPPTVGSHLRPPRRPRTGMWQPEPQAAAQGQQPLVPAWSGLDWAAAASQAICVSICFNLVQQGVVGTQSSPQASQVWQPPARVGVEADPTCPPPCPARCLQRPGTPRPGQTPAAESPPLPTPSTRPP